MSRQPDQTGIWLIVFVLYIFFSGCEYPPDCPMDEDDKFFIDPDTPIDVDDDCLPTETSVSCNPSWCTGVSDPGFYCVDFADVNAWADAQGYVMFTPDEEQTGGIAPRCDSTPD